MHPGLTIATVGIFLLGHTLAAQDSKSLPDKVLTLKFNYEPAINRATTPITRTYVQELQKLKTKLYQQGSLVICGRTSSGGRLMCFNF